MVDGCVAEVRYASLSMLLLPNDMHTLPSFTEHTDMTRWPLIVSEPPWVWLLITRLSSDRCSVHYFPEVQVRWAGMKGSALRRVFACLLRMILNGNG